jgi:hypothetical protein
MRPVKGLGILAALTIALGLVAVQPGTAAAYTTPQVAIRNLAYANLNKGPCDYTSLGGFFTAPDGTASCTIVNGQKVATGGWCGIFAAWVWAKSGHVDTTNVGHGPSSFAYNYGTAVQATVFNYPQVGDAVVFASPGGGSTPGHVGIVWSIDWSAYKVTVIAGNEGGSVGHVGYRTFYYNALSTSTPSPAYRPMDYVTPRTH